MTVLGPIDPEQLGPTITHEHCVVDLKAWFFEPVEASRRKDMDRPIDMSMLADLRRRPMSTTRDNMALDDIDLIVEELEHFRRAGGKSLVDVTCYGLGRDPIALQRISRATGLNIVMASGFYVENAHPAWVKDRTADQLAELMASEVTDGVGETGVKCGIIGEIGLTGIPKGAGRTKVGPVTPEEEKTLRAAARAALQTGLTVTVHLDPIPPRASITAVDILEEEGVPPERIILDHMDQVNDLDYHLEAAARGVFIEYDSLGRDHYTDDWGYDFDWGHDSWRVRFAQRLIEAGHGEQLLFSQDVCLKTDLRTYGGVGYSHVLNTICPTLRALGVSQDSIDQILLRNPIRALATDGVASDSPALAGATASASS
jgi:phosphotriesterase-related protein